MTGTPAALTAAQSGRVCAVAGRLQRDMRGWARAYPALFDAEPFDAALYSTLSLASAFSGPWLDSERLRMANRACLWAFALDWIVDYAAGSQEEVDGVVRRCLAVAGGAAPAPGDELTAFLADIRDELAGAPAFPALQGLWREELTRTLTGMAREYAWKAGGVRPSFEEYLANADNLGFTFVLVSHWAATGEPPPDGVAEVRRAAHSVQRVIRLLNDMATYDRDVSWGDLNALMLGVTRGELAGRISELAKESRELLHPVRARHPELAEYMERQMDFCAGFYEVSDYWGTM